MELVVLKGLKNIVFHNAMEDGECIIYIIWICVWTWFCQFFIDRI
jgi:hypothetical protein